jgi:hypothetical protein
MANQAAGKFVKQLIAAFSRFPTSKDTSELYYQKLSNWHLTQNEWDAALDRIIEVHTEENIPSLNAIYGFLKNAQAAIRTDTAGGLATWDMPNGYGYSLRVHNDQGVWIISDVVMRDSHGKEVHLQQHVGEPFGLRLPKGATNVIVSPDHLADPPPEDIPTQIEIKAIIGALVRKVEAA